MGENEDLSNGLLLRDIEEISKALYLHNPPKAFNSSSEQNVAAKAGNLQSKAKVIIKGSSHKDKKSSIWNWTKPLMAITHIHHQRFNCCFFLHVHSVEGLPSNFNNSNLCLSWKRKGGILRTRPALVCMGMTEFEETLMHKCTICASRNGPQNLAKYEPKLFLLHTYVIGGPTIDIGKHWIDLTRLLPLTLKELEGEKRSSRRWTMGFKLTGKAEGAILNVSFGFSVLDGNSFEPGYFVKVPGVVREGLPTVSTQGSHYQSPSMDVKFLNEFVQNQGLELGESISLLYRKLDEGKVDKGIEFDFFNETLEAPMKDQVRYEQQDSQRFDSSLIETINVEEIFKEEEIDLSDENLECNSKLDTSDRLQSESRTDDTKLQYSDILVKGSTKEESDSVHNDMLTSRSTLLDINKSYEQGNCTKSLTLDDDIAESIENDFLNMLSLDQNPSESGYESPEDKLLRQFEEDALAWENPIYDFDLTAKHMESCRVAPSDYGRMYCADDFDFSFNSQAVERHYCGGPMQSMRTTKRNVKMLENMETESLMHQWDLNENDFEISQYNSCSGFGSPVYLPMEKHLDKA